MEKQVDVFNSDLKPGDCIGGYHIERVEYLEVINAHYYELTHAQTGARHVHVSRDDNENAFGVTFKTVPEDSTGVAHILEHTVLCGSEKYPVRDPFFSMLKRSLSTFMNAFTASDWTMYPFSTQNAKDFYNLMDVYLDAVFFPNISRLSFKQEGHRLEIEDTEGDRRLVYKGVVYNEMRGAMSSADQILARSLLKGLLPDTTYANNSGGDPAVIPELTYEQLKAFHARHYHPSNAYFYTYGNLPLKKHLEFIGDRCLRRFTRIDPCAEVAAQPRWNDPRVADAYYPISRTEDPAKKCQICLAWLGPDIDDAFEVLVLTLLEQILLGNPGSPLRKALIESGLGSALSDSTGFSSDYRDTFFCCGLKDVAEGDSETMEAIVFDLLKTLAEKGIDRELIESAIHQIEFHRREVTNQPYPYGIKLLLSFSGSWIHGGDPVRTFRFDSDLEKIRSEIGRGGFFENRIKRYFLDNPHRLLFKLLPDPRMEEKENRRIADELKRKHERLARTEIETILQDTEALRRLQEENENPSVLPTLSLEDIPPTVQGVSETVISGCETATCYVQPTSGIFYFSAAAGLGSLDSRMVPLVPFFCHAITRCGTRLRGYAEMSHRLDRYTGGVGFSALVRTRYTELLPNQNDRCVPFIFINGKCLSRNLETLFEILREFFAEADFSQGERIRQLLMEFRANLESSVIHSGHRMAISLASRNFSTAAALNEIWHGVHQLKFIKDLTRDLTESSLKKISEDLCSMADRVFNRDNLKIALVGNMSDVSSGISCVKDTQAALRSKDHPGFVAPPAAIGTMLPREGWSTATAVSFVARTFPTVYFGHPDAPVLSIISKLLKSHYIHKEVREKGGAYGGLSLYSPEDGLFCMASYRDPHIVSTLSVFENALNFLRSATFTRDDINEAVLQICSEIDKPDPPGPAAKKAFVRNLLSLSDDARLNYKRKLLAVDKTQVLQVAETYLDPAKGASHGIAVISNEDKLMASNGVLKDNPLILFSI